MLSQLQGQGRKPSELKIKSSAYYGNCTPSSKYNFMVLDERMNEQMITPG